MLLLFLTSLCWCRLKYWFFAPACVLTVESLHIMHAIFQIFILNIFIILKHLMHGNLKILSTIEYPLQRSSSSSFLPVQFCVSNKMDWQMLSNHLLDIFHHWTVWPVGSFCQKMPDNFWHPIAFPWLHYDVAIEGNSTGSLSILF